MRQVVPVKVGKAEFLVETADSVSDPDVSGGALTPVSGALPSGTDTLEWLSDTIEAVTGQVVAAWEHARPDEATVEFNIAAEVKAGKLVGVLVGGGMASSLKVTLKWADSREDE